MTTDTVIHDGQTLTGTLGEEVKVSIADGATVTLDGVNIFCKYDGWDHHCLWAAITCLGDATLILSGVNSLHASGYGGYPGILPAKRQGEGEEYTLTISGSGSLTVISESGPGIGSEFDNSSCGNISITGGTITAIGASTSAGIGASYQTSCGNISISGGIVTAIGQVSALDTNTLLAAISPSRGAPSQPPDL